VNIFTVGTMCFKTSVYGAWRCGKVVSILLTYYIAT